MLKEISGNSNNDLDISQIRTLHKWLSYNRYTIFGYGGGFYIPWGFVLGIMTLLAVVFAPYMLYVLYKNGKRGWLVFFGISVGIPIVLAFINTGNDVVDTGLHFLPLLTFYFYCLILRYSVDDWVSDADMAKAIQAQDADR